MADRAALACNIIGIVGNIIISFGLFFFPAPTFYGIIKKKSVEEFKPDPHLARVLNCAIWVFYGMPFVHPYSILVVTINSVGLVFEFIYLTINYVYAPNKGQKKVALWLLVEAIFFAGIVLIAMLALHGTRKRSLVVGIMSDVLACYSLIHPFDIYVLISNGFGAISGLVELVLYAYYYFSNKQEIDDDDNTAYSSQKPNELQLSAAARV